eukprot:TRINITY_DN1848_c0_g1_i1.p2 TRINITY_DN1848_c0_g1~~TRINITY_DN1848_c0_g1_i1.p2  ORF type:complete len:226 (-),score=89.53 TRINITY_DN1848_c0_g1_i1:65-742(-)
MAAEVGPALRIGDIAPDFTAPTTEGDISFHEWIGNSWCILFSHPRDFTPVCTTELSQVACLKDEWASRNTKVIALSCDTVESHQAWMQDINAYGNCEVKYPIIGDENRRIAVLYNMLDQNHRDAQGMPFTVRSVFIINPDKKIQLIITYPAPVGRNFQEIIRVLDALQMVVHHKVATPVNWTRGKDVVVLPHIPTAEAEQMFPNVRVVYPYMRVVADPSVPAQQQ